MNHIEQDKVHHLALTYDYDKPEDSARQLIQALRPEWNDTGGSLVFKKFTDGITNTLCKAEYRRPNDTQSTVDESALLLRAYGPGTDVLIDRNRETRAHSLLAEHGLASPLLARFDNGLLYKFLVGTVCTPIDIRQPAIYRNVAQKLGQWHGTLSVDVICDVHPALQPDVQNDAPKPNVWTALQSWIDALPQSCSHKRVQQQTLQAQFDWLKNHLGTTHGLGGRDLVFAHCDLLCGNIIKLPPTPVGTSDVSFIDYEYASAAPAAFDIANHFSEWGGFDCDYSVLPTCSQRKEFLQHYVRSFCSHAHLVLSQTETVRAIDDLHTQINLYRGVPGFYWGVWSLIQAQISHIDFDYAAYAEKRLAEYYAWKDTLSEAPSNTTISPREARWAEL